MAFSFSDRSTPVGPLLTVFQPHPCRFSSAALGTAIFLVRCLSIISRIYNPVVIACEDKVHSISKNSPVRNSGYGNQGTRMDSSIVLCNVYNVKLILKCLKSSISKKAMLFLRMHK